MTINIIMIKIAISLLLLYRIISQSVTTLTQPSRIETNTYTLRKISTNITSLSTNITYMQTYSNAPLVFLSIISLHSFTAPSITTFTQAPTTITLTYFTVDYFLSCVATPTPCNIAEVDIDYLAYDFDLYPFVKIMAESLALNQTASTNNQYYLIRYVQSLTPSYNYSINCMLSGFQGMTINSEPSLYISANLYRNSYYYFNVNFSNLTLTALTYIRVLIDQTTMNSVSTGITSLSCDIGTIFHYSDPNTVENNPTPDFLPFAMFFGVSGFQGLDISLSNLIYIFNNTTPRLQTSIGYILFVTQSCPSNQLYVSTENLCYTLSSAFYYQATPATLMPCPYSCYQCVGPLSTNCKSCVQGWNRVLSSSRCLCITGFYDPGAPLCKNCTLAISGCSTCSSATNCLTCLPGCTALGFHPIYCDCPSLVQQNYSYNCPSSYYFDYTINACSCLPQTYYNANSKLCFPCATGCYLCGRNATYCLSCIDSYALVNNSCVLFYTSYALLGQASNYNNPSTRCIRWSNSVCTQKCKYYYYQSNCYTKCPLGSYNISFPYLTCQPCPKNCYFCYNYTICYQCVTTYYYFNTSILSCSPCSPHCLACLSASSCTLCDPYYSLVNNSCILPYIPSPTCDGNCSFCFISHQCLQCNIPLFLNHSSKMCISCSKEYGLELWSDGCHEICGDGKRINDDCDDGNVISGDGCSSRCEIQAGYQCLQINGSSYCWSRDIWMDWKIYNIFGTNQIIVSLYSPNFTLAKVVIALQCGFNFTITQRSSSAGRQQIVLLFSQSILHMQHPTDNSTFAGSISKASCRLSINQQQDYTLQISSKPSLLRIDYSSPLEKLNNGDAIRLLIQSGVYFSFSTLVLAISPMNTYSCLRICTLLYVSYLDYPHSPINSFAPYQALQTLFFIPPSSSSKELTTFSSEYYLAILWHMLALYLVITAWIEVVSKFLIKVCVSMEWKSLTKILGVIQENKVLAYQNMYVSFELALYCIALKCFANASSASTLLIATITLHILFAIISKVHFFVTFEQLNQKQPAYANVLVVEQIQNITIACLFLSPSSVTSYTSLLMVLFAAYHLLSLNRPPTQPSSLTSQKIALWQLRGSYAFQMVIQLLKVIYMCSGYVNISPSAYESLGSGLGLAIGLLTSSLILVSSVVSAASHVVRIVQIKGEGKRNQQEVQSVDMSSHAE